MSIRGEEITLSTPPMDILMDIFTCCKHEMNQPLEVDYYFLSNASKFFEGRATKSVYLIAAVPPPGPPFFHWHSYPPFITPATRSTCDLFIVERLVSTLHTTRNILDLLKMQGRFGNNLIGILSPDEN
jgi:hypothetical protein